MQQVIRSLIVFEGMNTKSISPARDKHHFVKRFQVIPGADHYAFFLCQADVVTRLLLHSRQNLFLALRDIDDDCARRLDIMRAYLHLEPLSLKNRKIFPSIRFKLEKDGVVLFATEVNFFPKREIRICFWDISNGQSQG